MKAWLRCRFPRYQVEQMLNRFPMHTVVLDHMLGTEHRADGLERFKKMTKNDLRRAVERSVPALVDGIYARIEAFHKVVAGGSVSNLKFAGDLGVGKTFEGKYESSEVFDKGLDKYIGLPNPQVYDAIVNEHVNQEGTISGARALSKWVFCPSRPIATWRSNTLRATRCRLC